MEFRSRYRYNPKTDFIAKGGFAGVFRAEDVLLGRQVALKVYSQEASSKYDLISEIRKVVQLEHANLCRYYDVALLENVTAMGEEEELQVGVLEYLDGGDIRSYVKQHPQHLHKLLIDVLQGLSYLHQHKIIHRDLKPANILIKNTPSGPVAKITDFGISKSVGSSSTKSSELLGTIEYMSPEQFSPGKYGIGGSISYNLDLWSFGCLTYELIMGESFFGSRAAVGTEQVMLKILEKVDSSKINMLPQPFKAVLEQCLVKDAKKRVQKAEELISILSGKKTAGAWAQQESQPQAGTTIGNKQRRAKAVEDEATKVIDEKAVDNALGGENPNFVVIPAEPAKPVKQEQEGKKKSNAFYLTLGLAASLACILWVYESDEAGKGGVDPEITAVDTFFRSEAAGPTAKIEFTETEYDFGTIKDGEIVTHTFRFRNTGDVPLVIQNASASCGCTVPEKPEAPIAPGQTGEIKVRFDSSNKLGSTNKTVTVTANTDPAISFLMLKGVVEKD